MTKTMSISKVKSQMSKVKSQSGFTLMELMIVIGLIVIFTVATLPYGLRFFDSRTLEEETTNIATILEKARSHSISGKDDSDWGVQFTGESGYNIFKGSECGSGEVYRTFSMPKGGEIETEIDCIVFERHTGAANIYNK